METVAALEGVDDDLVVALAFLRHSCAAREVPASPGVI
jgi:hypothetical protein